MTYQSSFKGYIVSLPKDKETRIKEIFKQPNMDIFTIVEAIHGNSLGFDKLKTMFDIEKGEKYIRRKLTLNEMACTLSHLKAMQMAVDDPSIQEDDYFVVAEDDIYLTKDWYNKTLDIINTVYPHKWIDRINGSNGDFWYLMKEHTEYAKAYENYNRDIFDLELPSIKPLQNIIYKPMQIDDKNSIYLRSDKSLSLYIHYHNVIGAIFLLFRKSLARKILNKATKSKPYWIADQYNHIFPLKNNICVDPPLAIANIKFKSNTFDEVHKIYSAMENLPEIPIIKLSRQIKKNITFRFFDRKRLCKIKPYQTKT